MAVHFACSAKKNSADILRQAFFLRGIFYGSCLLTLVLCGTETNRIYTVLEFNICFKIFFTTVVDPDPHPEPHLDPHHSSDDKPKCMEHEPM
jgi:hypothetical protein